MTLASIARISVLVVLLAAAGWHLLPLAAWQLQVAPGLREHPQAANLRVEMVRGIEASPADWQKLQLGNVSFRVPGDIERPEGCTSGEANCFVSGDARTLNVFAQDHLESYEEIINLRAPDERDLSMWRPSTANWGTIRALRDRVETSRSKLDAFRFETAYVKGVAVETVRKGVLRIVAAAYRKDEANSRGLAFSGFSREEALSMLGSIEIALP